MTKLLFLSVVSLFSFSVCMAQENKGYRTIEDKATLPFLNPSVAERQKLKLELENGLQVFLISDKNAEQSGAGLSVEAGSWQDPKAYPGMAHFCEHMLFMGNEAYPKEFEYMQYIADHGGSVNASTWPDRTLYMFSINNDAFAGALDRFSHFFIDPLFNTSCINRELHAVDQEHAKNIENDGWRQYMVFKETGNPNHPNSCFSTGNAKTLSGIPQEALKKWYREQYSANKMHLVVISTLPLEEIVSLVTSHFSKVPVSEYREKTLPEKISSSKQQGHIIYLKPIKDLRMLSLMWEAPDNFARDFERKAPEMAAYILSNEGENSLIQTLKREKLAEAIKASGERHAKNKLLFSIDIELTAQGVAQIDSVLDRTFQAIARLKESAIPKYIYDDVKKMAEINYQFQSREEAFNFVYQHAHDLIDEDLQTYPEKTKLPSLFDPQFVSAFVETLTPQSCVYFVIADPEKTGVIPDKKEKWMDAEYAIKEIPQAKLKNWAQITPSSFIALPGPNPFIPDGLAAISGSENKSVVIPTLLANDEMSKIYFAPDNNYFVPEISTQFNIKTPFLDGSAKSLALTEFFIKALTEKLSGKLFFAKTAGIKTRFGVKDLKLKMEIHGYSPKAALLIQEIFSALKSVTPTKEQFEIYKQTLLSEYDNESKELPVKQAKELLSSIIFNDAPLASEKLKALKNIAYDEFLSFSKIFLKSVFIEGTFYGNFTQKDAQSLWSSLKTTLSSKPYLVADQVKKNILVLPEKNGPYLIQKNTPRQGNSVVLLVEEGAFSFERKTAQQILSKALKESFFETLRTKQQTGYIAQAWDQEIEKQLLQFFAVQSSTHHPRDLIARFELFLEDFLKYLPETLTKERFEEIRKMLVITLQMPPENLTEMARRLHLLAFEYDGDFALIEKRIDAANAISYDKVMDCAQQFFARSNLKRLAILMEGVLNQDNDFHYEIVSKEDLCGMGHYISAK